MVAVTLAMAVVVAKKWSGFPLLLGDVLAPPGYLDHSLHDLTWSQKKRAVQEDLTWSWAGTRA